MHDPALGDWRIDRRRACDDLCEAAVSMSVTVNVLADGVALVSVRGEIDHNTTPQLTSVIRDETRRRPSVIRVDLGLVTFLDSGAVGALVSAHRDASAEGVRLVVHQMSPFVERQLRIVGVLDLLSARTGWNPQTDLLGRSGSTAH
jgi:anti-anti-sigma factor